MSAAAPGNLFYRKTLDAEQRAGRCGLIALHPVNAPVSPKMLPRQKLSNFRAGPVPG